MNRATSAVSPAGPLPKTHRVVSSFGIAIASQVIASSSNIGLMVLAARSSTPRDFGLFSLAFGTHLFFLQLVRAYVSEPLLARMGRSTEISGRDRTELALSAAFCLGIAELVLFAFIGLATWSTLGPFLLLVGSAAPFLLAQDTYRMSRFADRQASAAAANDAIWLVSSVGSLIGLSVAGLDSSIQSAFIAWAMGSFVAVAVAIGRDRLRLTASKGVGAIKGSRAYGGYYATEFLISGGLQQASIYAVLGIAGSPVVGAIRAVEAVLGPVNIATSAIRSLGTAEAAERRQRKQPIGQWAVMLSIALLVAALAWGALVAGAPDRLGEFMFGATWAEMSRLLLGAVIGKLAFAASSGAYVSIRAMGALRRGLITRVVVAAINASSLVYLSIAYGANGVAVALALGPSIGCLAWWFSFAQCARAERSH